ncbi:MAG TPA: LamG-like jellyroll fold domain-containing protein, partial [Candidatus Saccharimonadales bacterium]|nr:LamG-like jellyroll fold domain-containing protein [Candidatus Saccharimonadales bacterium]
ATNLQFQNFTIECWMRLTDASLLSTQDGSGSGYLFAFGEGGYGFGVADGGDLFLTQIGAGVIYASAEIADTNFHHVAVTESESNVVFYVDGVAYPAGVFAATYTFSTPAAIGARGDTLVNSLLGVVDELSVYDRALSAAEIESIYGARSSGKCVPPVPIIAAQAISQIVTAYSPALFTVLADGPLPLLYQWTFDGTNLAGATNSTLSFDAALPSEAGTYSVIVGTAPNVTNSSNAVLTVTLPPPPIILSQPASHIGVAEDYTTFSVVAQSQAPVPTYYQWSWNGGNLPAATNSELVISNLTLADSGTYTVKVSNPFFATNSQPAVLTMIPAPTGTNRIVANLDPNELSRAVEAGGSVTFVCNGTIELSQPVMPSHDVIVDAGTNTMILSGGSGTQLLAIPLGVNVTLRNLAMTDGIAISGGAISNSGVLTISNVTFAGNTAELAGGAIYNSGSMSITGATFTTNSAFGEGPRGDANEMGGAIYNTNGTVNLSNVAFLGNSAEITVAYGGVAGSAYGGGIFNGGGIVYLKNVSFTGNLAQGGSPEGFAPAVSGWGFGGALYSAGGSITGNEIECTNNTAGGGDGTVGGGFGSAPYGYPGAGEGGAFYLEECMAALTNGWFLANSASCAAAYNSPAVSSEGGALFNAGWTVLAAVGFAGNSCTGVNGIDGQFLGNAPDLGTVGGPAGGGIGGAIYNMGLLLVTNCTWTGNAVSGGSGGVGDTCEECDPQFTGPNGAPGNALGGALANFGTVTIVSNAFLNNSASGPGADVGTIYNVANFEIDTNTTISPDTVDSSPGAFAPFLALMPQSQVVVVGTTVRLEAMAVGAPAPTYQ